MEDSTNTIVPKQSDVLTTIEAEYPWEQMDGEPQLWYRRFTSYFLVSGPGRTLYGAYELMVSTEFPSVAKARKIAAAKPDAKPRAQAITSWGKVAKTWRWRERSMAFDRFTYKAASAQVDRARITLLGSANKAAEALVSALSNPRLQVAAAKEILDRAGLPGTINLGIGQIEKFTADELNQAEQEVAAWESQTQVSTPDQKLIQSPKSE